MRELVLTGKEDCWPATENEANALYLSIGCFAFNPKYTLAEAARKFEIIAAPFSSRNDFVAAYEYTNKLVIRIRALLAQRLNEVYETRFSNRYWNIITTRWLLHFIEQTYVHYLTLLKVAESGEEFQVTLPVDPFQLSNDDYGIIMKNAHLHDYNLCLLSQLIQCGNFRFIKPVSKNVKLAWKYPIHNSNCVNWREKLSRLLFPTDVAWGNIYGLGTRDNSRLRAGRIRFFRSWFKDWSEILPKMTSADNLPLNIHPENEYETILAEMISKNMPSIWFSGIPRQKRYFRKKYLIGNDIWLGFEKAAAIARIIENGGKWYSVQHGGAYNQLKCLPQEFIERDLSDGLITWGYEKKSIPLPSPMLSRLPERSCDEGQLVYLSNSCPMYYYRLQQFFEPRFRIQFFAAREKFIQMLYKRISAALLFRPYLHHDYGDGDIDLIKKLMPERQLIYSGANELLKKIASSRLCIIDHSSTGVLEVMSMNVPSVWFWDPEQFVFTDEAQRDLEKLEAAGIYHRTPAAAAAHVNRHYDEIDNWWLSGNVQKARRQFCLKYARVDRNYIKNWITLVKNLPK
ncbi:MAG: LIC12162 family protein [Victivallaceae bacterium]|nr:LIC12162 family protein [Victivallaceae bacterium]